MSDDLVTLNELKDVFNAFRKSRILLTAYELDIFSIIGSGVKTVEQIASAAKTDERATTILLNALCAVQLLVKKNNRFLNTEAGLKYLDKKSPEYISGFHHTNNLWDSWSTLTEVMKTGSTLMQKRIGNRDETWLEFFISAIIHSFSNEQNLFLIKKCTKALNKHGQLVIQDYIMDEDRTTPVPGALFAVNMLVATESGNTYTESEIRSWFDNAGITFYKRIDTPFNMTQIIGRKINTLPFAN